MSSPREIDAVATSDSPEPAPERSRRRRRIGEFSWVWIGLLVVIVLSALIAPDTLRPSVLSSVLPFTALLAIAAVGQTFVIQQRGIDLSLPGTIALAAVVTGRFYSATGSLALALVVALIASAVIGIVNGLLVTFVSITPLVTTLAVNALSLGAVWSLSLGLAVAAPADLVAFTRFRVLGVPTVAVIAVVLIVVLAIVMRTSVAGRRFVLAGASEGFARAAGIRSHSLLIGSYVASALCAGLVGILLSGFTGSATPAMGETYLLPSIAAVVIGGTALTGGRGSVIASAAAALLLTQLEQVTYALGAPTSTQLFIQSGALVVAVALRSLNLRVFARKRKTAALEVQP